MNTRDQSQDEHDEHSGTQRARRMATVDRETVPLFTLNSFVHTARLQLD
jgi:hypothetical protein